MWGSGPEQREEAKVYKDRVVKSGDEVRLLPVELREKDKDFGDAIAQEEFNRLCNWLGDGPFVIHCIGQWPCGKYMLYLKKEGACGPGVDASDFM